MSLHNEQRNPAHVFGGLVGVILAAGLHVGGDERGRVDCDEVDRRRAAADGLRIPPEQRRQLLRLLIPAVFDAQAGAEQEQVTFTPQPRSCAEAGRGSGRRVRDRAVSRSCAPPWHVPRRVAVRVRNLLVDAFDAAQDVVVA